VTDVAGVERTDDAPVAAPEEFTRKRLILAVCCIAQFLVILDLSIVNVALPTIQAALRISAVDLQWVIDAYAIIFAGFLMLAGRATDLFGQRRVFGLALLAFSVASLIGGLAPNSAVLIGARGAQGLAGAGMAAASLAIITSTFAAGPERHRAIALWGAMNGAGGAAGTLLGGVLTDVLSWRWVLLINVPIGIAAVILALRTVPEHRARRHGSFDLLGALVLTAGLLIATYGGVQAGSEGFGSAEALVPIAFGSLLLMTFGRIERRAKDPLIPPDALTPQLKKINLIVLLFSASLFAMWFAASLYLQQVLSLSPLETGLIFLPMALGIFIAARPAGKLVGRAGVRAVLGSGLLMLATGLVLLSRVGAGGSAIQYVMLPGFLIAAGIGFSVVSSTIAATISAGPSQAGLTSSLVNTARQVGGGLGLAVLISLATQRTAALIGDGDPVDEALTAGFSLSFLTGAVLVAIAAVLTFTLLPGPAEPQKAFGRRVLTGAAVVIAAFVVIEIAVPRSQAAPPGEFVTDGAASYVSAPGLHPPQLQVIKPFESSDRGPGYFMTANFLDVTEPPIIGQSGPMMLDDDMQPVWFKPVPTEFLAANLDVHTYQGRPVLAYWQGDVGATGEINSGEVVIVDQSYRPVATLEGADGWVITLHSLLIKDGLAWVTANKNIQEDLSGVGGVNHGVMVDSALQAYDIKTGELRYTWSAREHIPMRDSETQPPPNGFPWDAYHINWLQLTDDGKALVSMRNTSAAYLFDLETGKIEWQLGGERSSFELEPEAEFEWQHDVTLHDDSIVTLFDNHCCEITGAGEYIPSDRGSRALRLELDTENMTARAVDQYSHGETFRSQYMGNMQTLENDNVLVGFGEVPYISEFSPGGEIIFDAALPGANQTYRVHRREWVGRPADPPSAAARGTTVYASWNGATEVRRWRVLAEGSTTPVAEADRKGFETAIEVREGPTRLKVQALDADGQVLGTSKTITTKGTG
jgi:EmrB/QacA subfamily drug resistance transporter